MLRFVTVYDGVWGLYYFGQDCEKLAFDFDYVV